MVYVSDCHQVHGGGPAGGVYAYGMHPGLPSGVDASITAIEMTLIAIILSGAVFGPQCIFKLQVCQCYHPYLPFYGLLPYPTNPLHPTYMHIWGIEGRFQAQTFAIHRLLLTRSCL